MNKPCEHLKDLTEDSFPPPRTPKSLRRMYQRGNYVGIAAGVLDLRPRRLLRLVARKARHETLPRHAARGHALDHAWGAMDLVLRA